MPMLPQQNDPQSHPSGPRPQAADQHSQATRYGAAPPAEADATNYVAAPPTPVDTAGTRYAEQPTDPDRTNYQAPSLPDEPNATRYAAGTADPHATGYTPTDGKSDAPPAGRLPCRF